MRSQSLRWGMRDAPAQAGPGAFRVPPDRRPSGWGASSSGREPGGSRRPRRFAQRKRLACSPFSACPRAKGSRRGPPTPSSGCTRRSSDASRRRPCCPRPKPPPCCSGRCWLRAQRQTLRVSARSPCARWAVGKPWARRSPPLPLLTSPPDPTNCQPAGETPPKLFPPHPRRHRLPTIRKAAIRYIPACCGALRAKDGGWTAPFSRRSPGWGRSWPSGSASRARR